MKLEKYLKESDQEQYKILGDKLEERVDQAVDRMMGDIKKRIEDEFSEVSGDDLNPMLSHKLKEYLKQTTIHWLASNTDLSKIDK